MIDGAFIRQKYMSLFWSFHYILIIIILTHIYVASGIILFTIFTSKLKKKDDGPDTSVQESQFVFVVMLLIY